MPQLSIHHLTLSVTDTKQSADWYRLLLGDAIAVEREAPGWKRTRLQWPSGLVIGLTQHDSTDPNDAFDHSRVGLDHIGLACANEAEVRGWLERMDVAGIEHGPMEDVAYGWAVTARDPDGIAVEFFCPKP
jgi:catechol 2,3-dioxygenase-like lactoylglutathione lyase family enzyme